MSKLPVHLAFCCDRNVVDGLVTTIAAAAVRLGSGYFLAIHVIDCGLGAEMRAQIQSFLAQKLPTVQIEFVTLDAERLKIYPRPAAISHIPPATYARLLLHELLPEVPQVIYLDCDLLVTTDLVELFLTPLEGCPYAAVQDSTITHIGHERESLTKDLPQLDRPDATYHNGGVLLLNLAKLRDLDVSALYGRALGTIEARYADQSLMNGVFHGQWKILPRRWNRQVMLGRDYSVFPDRPRAIWHFISHLKPWHFHRRLARGLVRQWQDERDAIGWTPTTEPTIQANPSWFKDLVKQGRSWIECRGLARQRNR